MIPTTEICFTHHSPQISGVRTGKIVRRTRNAEVYVDYPGNPCGPLRASLTATVAQGACRSTLRKGASVLLAFADGEPGKPILFDVVCAGAAVPPSDCDEPNPTPPPPASTSGRPTMARICDLREGVVYIDHEGNTGQPIAARTAIVLRNLVDEVVIEWVGETPVIIAQLLPTAMVAPAENNGDVVMRCRSITIQAEQHVSLVAGSSKVVVDARGSVTTTAAEVTSRARGPNRVQGGCVLLN